MALNGKNYNVKINNKNVKKLTLGGKYTYIANLEVPKYVPTANNQQGGENTTTTYKYTFRAHIYTSNGVPYITFAVVTVSHVIVFPQFSIQTSEGEIKVEKTFNADAAIARYSGIGDYAGENIFKTDIGGFQSSATFSLYMYIYQQNPGKYKLSSFEIKVGNDSVIKHYGGYGTEINPKEIGYEGFEYKGIFQVDGDDVNTYANPDYLITDRANYDLAPDPNYSDDILTTMPNIVEGPGLGEYITFSKDETQPASADAQAPETKTLTITYSDGTTEDVKVVDNNGK